MSDFLGGSEISARAEMLAIDNKLQNAELQAKKAENTKSAADLKQMQKISRDFESIFLGYMLKQMRATVPKDSLFGESNAKDIFYDMYDSSIAQELSKAGGIGLATILYNQLSKIPDAEK